MLAIIIISAVLAQIESSYCLAQLSEGRGGKSDIIKCLSANMQESLRFHVCGNIKKYEPLSIFGGLI